MERNDWKPKGQTVGVKDLPFRVARKDSEENMSGKDPTPRF